MINLITTDDRIGIVTKLIQTDISHTQNANVSTKRTQQHPLQLNSIQQNPPNNIAHNGERALNKTKKKKRNEDD